MEGIYGMEKTWLVANEHEDEYSWLIFEGCALAFRQIPIRVIGTALNILFMSRDIRSTVPRRAPMVQKLIIYTDTCLSCMYKTYMYMQFSMSTTKPSILGYSKLVMSLKTCLFFNINIYSIKALNVDYVYQVSCKYIIWPQMTPDCNPWMASDGNEVQNFSTECWLYLLYQVNW